MCNVSSLKMYGYTTDGQKKVQMARGINCTGMIRAGKEKIHEHCLKNKNKNAKIPVLCL
jgi:hypothetical protein